MLKTTYYAEYNGKQTDYSVLVDAIKKQWTADGNLMKNLTKLDIYFKPDESVCYYVINDEIKGSFEV
jgi:hypothetical protein